MIELPRAALRADQIAEHAAFFSFGTNDLTQMALGLSRDDPGKFLEAYIRADIFQGDPFQTLDQGGVGELVEIAAERGRAARPDLKLGICGEHGGDLGLGGVLRAGRPRLRLLLALPRADRAAGRGAGGAAEANRLERGHRGTAGEPPRGWHGAGPGPGQRRGSAPGGGHALLDAAWNEPRAAVVGLTGPPGVGKSTLASAFVRAWRAQGRTGVIAVDPSSRRTQWRCWVTVPDRR